MTPQDHQPFLMGDWEFCDTCTKDEGDTDRNMDYAPVPWPCEVVKEEKV